MRFYTCSLPTMHPSWKCCGRRRGTPVSNTGSREGCNFNVSLIYENWFFWEWHEGWNIKWISCKVKSLRQNIFRLCAEIQSYAWSEAKFCNSQKSGLHNNCFMRILYKSDVHWAIYIWWESSDLTILMPQNLSRIKVSWFRRDVVCDQPLLTKTPSRG